MRTIINDDQYLHYTINNFNKNEQGSYKEILEPIDNLLKTMINKHNKVLFIRFDLTYPQYGNFSNNNELLSRFIETLTVYWKRKKIDPLYLWVREQATSDNHHYHFMLLLNGNLIQNPFRVFEKAEELWGRCLGVVGKGLVHKGIDLMIRRNTPEFEQQRQDCFKHASYLAKVYSKGSAPPGVRGMGMSNL
ncbi:MAG: inovirus-type Gp2 protein [Desulfobacterales bacterium]|nr:inovirus-type Gp2 protein [Desulfobacterales bacterium]MDD4071405.1 inovirus-type Gp2 protein [Desulfobacterales bacterium]MDD4391450.1 inovirus-type Gp2 protein [Desulfobacterales bacterium]